MKNIEVFNFQEKIVDKKVEEIDENPSIKKIGVIMESRLKLDVEKPQLEKIEEV
jgi:hypothetical protein